MPTFKSYPASAEVPSRKTRKGLRNSVFVFNKKLIKSATKARRAKAKEALNG